MKTVISILCALLAHIPSLYIVQAWQDSANPSIYIDEFGTAWEFDPMPRKSIIMLLHDNGTIRQDDDKVILYY